MASRFQTASTNSVSVYSVLSPPRTEEHFIFPLGGADDNDDYQIQMSVKRGKYYTELSYQMA